MNNISIGPCWPAALWLVLIFSALIGNALRADGPVAVEDQAWTPPNLPVLIAVLANDRTAESNQLAILNVSAPAHGKIFVGTNAGAGNPGLQSLFDFAGGQLSNSVAQIGNTNRYPRYTQTNGLWITRAPSAGNWVSGFFPGALWLLYEQTGDARYRSWAESWMAGIAPLQYSTEVDDVGFMINTSFGNGYRLTGNPDWRTVLLQTAQSFSTRFNAAAGCLSTWGAVTNEPFDVFLDTMMNLEVLFRAFDLGGNTNFYTYAYSHAEKTMFNHVRADGSTYHIVKYDGDTGAVLWRGTFAGASDQSTWARGQSWAIYGFTMAYCETGDPRFLNTAQRLADYYLTNVPPDFVPYWDYQASHIPNEPRDSSAAAIALSGLLELSQHVTNATDAEKYWQAAWRTLSSLSSTNYLAQGSISSGILLHGTGEPPTFTSSEVDVSLIYGDYYFVEALKRYKDIYAHSTLTYIPDTNFVGTDTLTYQVCDSGGGCATAMVTVVVEPLPNPTISFPVGARSPVISILTCTGHSYFLEFADDLGPAPSWRILTTNIAGTGSTISITDTNIASRRFYRIGLTP